MISRVSSFFSAGLLATVEETQVSKIALRNVDDFSRVCVFFPGFSAMGDEVQTSKIAHQHVGDFLCARVFLLLVCWPWQRRRKQTKCLSQC